MLGSAADRRFMLALLIAAIVMAPRPAGTESAIEQSIVVAEARQ